MRKILFVAAAILALIGIVVAVTGRAGRAPVYAAENQRTALLVRFGLDGVKDADWSGTVSPAPARLVGWQFAPGEEAGRNRWKCATREQNYWDTPYERSMGPTANRVKVTSKGIIIEYDSPPAGEIRIETSQGAFSFSAGETLWSEPRQFLDGRAEVRSAPAVARFATEAEVEDYPSMLRAKDGTLWLAYAGWTRQGDQILVRKRTAAGWSEPEAITESRGDYFRTAIAQDGAGRIWVAWSANVAGNFDLRARSFDGNGWSRPERLTSAEGSDIYHALASDSSGRLYLAYMSSRSGNFDIWLRTFDGKKWSEEIQVSSDPANDWQPALAAAPDGRVTVLWDTYAKGNYDVVSRTFQGGKLGPLTAIAETGAFESRASARYDGQGRLWIAWDEGDWNWGKDYGNLIPQSGMGLMGRRQVRVGVLANGRLQETSARIAEAVPAEFRQAFQAPLLELDGSDNPWIFFRYRTNLPRDVKGEIYRGMWRLGATGYRNGQWIPMIEFPEGYGRQDAPMAAALTETGGLDVAWITDGRVWPAAFPKQQDVLLAAIPAATPGAAPELRPFQPPTEAVANAHPTEAADLSRVRGYRTKASGRTLRIARGDIHRHTDLSWDGNRDGTLHDSYRYAMDAAGFEYLGVCDHQAGESIPYHWWMIQKAVDLFTISGRFAPLYSYERSLSWPNGHRNVVFPERGRPILDIPEDERRGKAGATKLYEYLRRFGGLATSHTSATGAGTDWRDSDPELEPVVEIYQGYRNNFEEPEAPRHPSDGESKKFAAGFVWSAWGKGIKMGVQSSSDHVSTHISYAAVFVDQIERHAIFNALKARRSYAATDNLILDFRMGDRFMGESFTASGPVRLSAYIRGTGPLAKVSLVRSNRIIYTAPGASPEVNFAYTDNETPAGESYYYIRVEQNDGQLGWTSPVWIGR